MNIEVPIYWFAARTRACQELSLRNKFQQWEIEHYLPTEFVMRKYRTRMKRVEIPVIRNMIFIRCTKQKAFALLNDYALKLSYLKDPSTRSLLVIPDKQLEDFKLVMSLAIEKTIVDDGEITPGDKVQIVEGELLGVEGTMIRFAGKSHVAIRIVGVITAVVKLPRQCLIKIK